MGVLDGWWHVLNFFAPAVGVGVFAAGLAKLCWRHELKRASLWRMTVWAVLAASLALFGGLLWAGRDGKMATYGAMLLACALALWWAGWGERRA